MSVQPELLIGTVSLEPCRGGPNVKVNIPPRAIMYRCLGLSCVCFSLLLRTVVEPSSLAADSWLVVPISGTECFSVSELMAPFLELKSRRNENPEIFLLVASWFGGETWESSFIFQRGVRLSTLGLSLSRASNSWIVPLVNLRFFISL